MLPVALDTALPPRYHRATTARPCDEVIAFYRQRLPAEGWTAEQSPYQRHGDFAPAGAELPARANFARGEQGPSWRIMCLPGPVEHITGQVNVAKQPATNAREQRRRQMIGHDHVQILPTPVAPPGSLVAQGGGGSAGPDHVDMRATIETDLDVPAVGAHYREQIERAGWEPRGDGESGPIAWSAWAFKDTEGEP